MSTTTAGADDRLTMRERVHVPRSRGAASGVLLVLLGLWGGLVPLVGPWFDFSFTPDDAWHVTSGRFWVELLPAAATVVGGLALLRSGNRVSGSTGAWLAAAGGAWFIVGRTVSQLWNDGTPEGGSPTASSTLGRVVEQLAFFEGLGALVLLLAAGALGRLSVVGVRDVRHARAQERDADADRADRADRRVDDRVDDRVDRRVDERIDERVDERVDQRVDERSVEVDHGEHRRGVATDGDRVEDGPPHGQR